MTQTKTTAEEVREVEARTEASLFHPRVDTVADATARLQKDPAKAAEGMEDQELADAIAALQVIRHKLGQVEHDLTHALGKRAGRGALYLSDGRQAKLERSADRKEWDHDGWKHDARRVLVEQTLENLAVTREAIVVDPTTGLETEQTLASIIHSAVTNAQEVHGSTSPRVTNLRALGLVTTDYCTSTPGSWRLNVVKPTEKKDTTDA